MTLQIAGYAATNVLIIRCAATTVYTVGNKRGLQSLRRYLRHRESVALGTETNCTTLGTDTNCMDCGDNCQQQGEVCCSRSCTKLGTNNNCSKCGDNCSSKGQTCCNRNCVDLKTDPNNCGKCGGSCAVTSPSGKTYMMNCVNGARVCPPNWPSDPRWPGKCCWPEADGAKASADP